MIEPTSQELREPTTPIGAGGLLNTSHSSSTSVSAGILLGRSHFLSQLPAEELELYQRLFRDSLAQIFHEEKVEAEAAKRLLDYLAADPDFFRRPDQELQWRFPSHFRAIGRIEASFALLTNLLRTLPSDLRDISTLSGNQSIHGPWPEVTAMLVATFLSAWDITIRRLTSPIGRGAPSFNPPEFMMRTDGSLLFSQNHFSYPVEPKYLLYETCSTIASMDTVDSLLAWGLKALAFRPDMLSSVDVVEQTDEAFVIRIGAFASYRGVQNQARKWKRKFPKLEIQTVQTPYAAAYLAFPREATVKDWAYGGMRVVAIDWESEARDRERSTPTTIDTEFPQPLSKNTSLFLKRKIADLAIFESGVKHSLINFAIERGLKERMLNELLHLDRRLAAAPELREQYQDLRFTDEQTYRPIPSLTEYITAEFWQRFSHEIRGGRCIIAPRSEEEHLILSNPQHPLFTERMEAVLGPIAQRLNWLGGRLKLTADLGKNFGIAQIIGAHTEHVLGIAPEMGGAGSKSSYTASGIISVMQTLGFERLERNLPITILGSAGSLGTHLSAYVEKLGFNNVALCDPIYQRHEGDRLLLPSGWFVIDSEKGKFPAEALRRGGVIIATALNQELANSRLDIIPNDTQIYLAQNMGLPRGKSGAAIARELADRGLLLIPGPILTLAGAMTSRLEWSWRRSHIPNGHLEEFEILPEDRFPKPLAHGAARALGRLLSEEIIVNCPADLTPYEHMLKLSLR